PSVASLSGGVFLRVHSVDSEQPLDPESIFSENDEDSSLKFREQSGVLHLFRSSSQSSIPSPSFRSSLVFILTIPNHLSFDDLIPWCGPHLHHLHRLVFISGKIGILSSFEYLYSPLALFGKKKAAPPPPSKKAATVVTPANDELAKWYGTSRGIKNSQCSFLGATKTRMHFISNWLMNPSALASEYLIVDPKSGEEKQIIVSADDGIRPNSTLMDLAKLKPAFQKDGSTIACNASQVSDGAAAVLLMKRRIAVQKGLPIIGTFRKKSTELACQWGYSLFLYCYVF
ncbi:hypothetical protein S83_051421, partial [Arachis hypogaea]